MNGPAARQTTYSKVWDVDLLAFVWAQQAVLKTDELTVAGNFLTDTQLRAADLAITLAGETVDLSRFQLTTASGSVSSAGNNTCITPSSGKKLRVFYVSYNPSVAMECAYRFGPSGSLFLRTSVPATSVVAKEFGDTRYVQGAVDESLILTLSLGAATLWNAFYLEV